MEQLKSHLLKRPFAHVFNNLPSEDDKNDPVALQLMCVLDYKVDRKNLYKRIKQTQQPKLLLDLMRFRSYKSFLYFEYQGHSQLDNKNLKCKFCEFFGPYVLVLTHMTINHGEHIGSVECAYCNQTELKEHFSDDTMQACYDRYLQKPDIIGTIEDNSTSGIITDFYALLKQLSFNLGVHIRRNLHNFKGTGYGGVEPMKNSDGEATNSYKINDKSRKNQKPISTEKLSTLVNQIWMQFYRQRLLPVSLAQNDNGTRERSTRLNNRRIYPSQNDDSETVNEELNQNEFETKMDEGASTSSHKFSVQTSDAKKTAEDKFGEYVAQRLGLQTENVKRRRLEAAIQRTISNFEIDQLENQ